MGLMQTRPRQHFNISDRLQVAIAGFDVEGQATYRYLKPRGDIDITILDERKVDVPPGVAADMRPGVFDGKLEYDQIWRTPGLSPYKLQTEAEITSGTKEFFARCKAPIIGVTGSKGKGTTASLIHAILVEAGHTSHLVGNIGQPALDALKNIEPEHIVVYELSSFQLWDMEQSPATAVVLMVEPEHLDIHKNLEDYVQAKQNIARWQGPDGTLIHHPANELSLKVAQVGLGQKKAFLTTDGAYIEGNTLMIDEQDVCSVKEFGLVGKHNHENIAAAVTAAWEYTQNKKAVAKAVTSFTGLEHRLQIVAEKKGITYVDDSIATTPSAAIAAIHAFSQPKIIILGGSDKGADYAGLAQAVKDGNVKQALLIGETAGKIAAALGKAGVDTYERVDGSVEEAVRRAKTLAAEGDAVLLSPASASFDQFKNYRERAERFLAAVGEA